MRAHHYGVSTVAFVVATLLCGCGSSATPAQPSYHRHRHYAPVPVPAPAATATKPRTLFEYRIDQIGREIDVARTAASPLPRPPLPGQ